jgi:hemerythrin-like domain-containing protein
MHSALATIEHEHHGFAAVLQVLQSLVRDTQQYRAPPDFTLLATVLYYIDAFPEQFHHPHEDEHLFKRLLARTHEADAVLDDLQAEHAAGPRMIRELERALVHWQAGNTAAAAAFAELAQRYAEFIFQHMRKEEELVFPAAARALNLSDWETIDAAFLAHPDPLFGPQPQQEFGTLYRRIATLAPQKIKRGMLPRREEEV